MLRKLAFLFLWLNLSCGAALCQSSGPPDRYEIDAGVGRNLNGTHVAQFTLIGARIWQLGRLTSLRLEPTFEVFRKESFTMVVLGASPVFRFMLLDKMTAPFIDLGAGLNFESRQFFANRNLGDHFAFGLMAGGGIQIDRRWKLFYRYRHLSNAGLFPPNQGIDAHYILAGYSFN
jgi:hypothetical protein